MLLGDEGVVEHHFGVVVPVEFAADEGASGAVVRLAVDARAAVELAVVLAVEMVVLLGDAVGVGVLGCGAQLGTEGVAVAPGV